ncbi:MAG: 23S rRNA (guanosine(2251)-2'-O)-methyltransferase RlmB [Heliobacteriaceae bacterium]|nr:23S rRNA (guanosine(2251)-2'-O)-methyltransferase RlmB [Heliobacteriaceae bacterium]MDD4587868.1 23S rRNA (guanosine(2251)-2'-O)-methyltransferase RlmB [Heliobacteriaceae bacterium]
MDKSRIKNRPDASLRSDRGQQRERPPYPAEMEREDVLIGRQPVLEAFKAGRPINKLVVAKGVRHGSLREITGLARTAGIPVIEVDREVLDRRGGRGHQGVLAYVAPKEYATVADILNLARERGEAPFILILDELTDPQNVGALLRTAEGAGVHGVIVPKRHGVGLTETVAKVAAGAVEHLAVARVTNMVQTVTALKDAGLWIIGGDAAAERPFYEQDFSGPVGLIVGSEGKGISRLLKDHCDFLVSIPMKGRLQSLNAATAGALLMYERVRRTGLPPCPNS